MSIKELIEINKLVYGVDKPKVSRLKTYDFTHKVNFGLSYVNRNQILYFDAPVYMTFYDSKATVYSSFVVTNFVYMSDILDIVLVGLNKDSNYTFSLKSVVPDYFEDKGNFISQFGNNVLTNCYLIEYDNDIWLW